MNCRAIAIGTSVLAALGGSAQAQNTERASIKNGLNNLGGNGNSGVGYTTPSGRYTVFTSASTDLIAGDGNGKTDIFVRDRWTNATVRVSVPSPNFSGEANGNSALASPGSRVMSDDGRFVIFESEADNLVPSDTNGVADIFVHDRDLDGNGVFDEAGVGKTRTSRVNLTNSNSQAIGGCPQQTCTHYSNQGIISATGRYVAWQSPFNFTSDPAAFQNIYWRDRDTDSDGIMDESNACLTKLVSTREFAAGVGQQGDGGSSNAAMSGNGRYVAFESSSRFLVFSDSDANQEVFVKDLTANTMARISKPLSGNDQPDGNCAGPSISDNGRYVAFSTSANNLATDVNTAVSNIVVKDRDTDNDGVFDETGAMSFQNVSKFRNPFGIGNPFSNLNGSSSSPTISADGRFVSFASAADNFARCILIVQPGDPVNPECTDSTDHDEVFVFDRQTDSLRRASITRDQMEPGADCTQPTMSSNGRWVTFTSAANNIDFNDVGSHVDTFVRALSGPANQDCNTAQTVTLGSVVSGETYGANAEGTSTCPGDTSPAAWHKITASCNGQVTMTTQGSPFDTVLSVYAGSCPATLNKLVACNDDAASIGTLWSSVTVNLSAGQDYVIRVSGYSFDGGHYVLNLGGCAAPPCAADFNQDGFRNPDDLADFITCFFLDVQFPGICVEADFNGDTSRDPDDLADFITAFFLGCP